MSKPSIELIRVHEKHGELDGLTQCICGVYMKFRLGENCIKCNRAVVKPDIPGTYGFSGRGIGKPVNAKTRRLIKP